jgi:hypothetical protein
MAYHSFGGEVEASNTPTIRRFILERRHQLSRISQHVVSPPLFSSGLIIGGTAYPFVMITCATCGNTRFLNAVSIGLFPIVQQAKPKEDGGKSGS